MKRTPVAHVIFPRPSLTQPVPESVWQAAAALTRTPDLDVTVLMPVPTAAMRGVHGWARRMRGAAPWPEGFDACLERLDPRPTLVPYVPLPRRSIESATIALATYLVGRPRAGRPQVVQGSFLDEGGYAATAIGRVLGVPSIAVAHGGDVRAARDRAADRINRRRRARNALARAERVIAVSHPLAQELAVMGIRADVLPFTADAERFVLMEPGEARAPEILFVGRLGAEEGVDLLIDAFAQVTTPEARLRLIGPSTPDVDVPSRVRALGLTERVSVEADLDVGTLGLRYHHAACLALAGRFASFPSPAVEAMLCGRPVVATAATGVSALVDDEVGALVRSAEPAAFARGLDDVLKRTFDGEALRRRAMPMTWQATGPRLVALTRGLLAAP